MYLDKPDPKAFIEFSNNVDDVYNNIDGYNPKRRQKILVVFDDMLADINVIKKFQSMVKELFFRCGKLTLSLIFISRSYFLAPKKVRLNSTNYLIMKIHNKRELQSIAINHSANIDYNNFMNVYRKFTSEPHSFLLLTLHYQLIILCILNNIF